VGAGLRPGRFPTEREEIGAGGLGKEMVLTGGPHPSATSGREGEGRRVGWAAAQEEGKAGAGGIWANRPKGRKGGEKNSRFLFFPFPNQISK